MKRTPWYSSATNPARVGWYEVIAGWWDMSSRYWWDGQAWRAHPTSAFTLIGLQCFEFNWRGLTAPVEASK